MRIPSELIKQELMKESAKGNGDEVIFIRIKTGIEIAAISINLHFDFIDMEKCSFYGMRHVKARKITMKSCFDAVKVYNYIAYK